MLIALVWEEPASGSPTVLPWLLTCGTLVWVLGATGFLFLRRYKRCPPDKLLVIYGRTGEGGSAVPRVLHGGGAFVLPWIQDHAYLSLTPIRLELTLPRARDAGGRGEEVACTLTVAIGADEALRQRAAERLLNRSPEEVARLAEDVVRGQLHAFPMDVLGEALGDVPDSDPATFYAGVQALLDPRLAELGMVLVTLAVADG